MPHRKTPLYENHQKLGARFVPFAGWAMPVQYEGIVKEHSAVRNHAGLFDVSHMGELAISGPQAATKIDSLITNHASALPVGKALYTVACNEFGNILDDLIVYRLGQENFSVVCNASNRTKIVNHFDSLDSASCTVQDISDETALIALQGPATNSILASIDESGASDAVNLKRFRVTPTSLFGAMVTVARTGYTGEDGIEIFCKNEDASRIWEGLFNTGTPFGLKPVGLGARDTLRLEAALCLYGQDIDESTNPFQAGLGWVVKLDKGPFLGGKKLTELSQNEREEGLKLVGLEMTARGIARHGYPILSQDSDRIGRVTSGCPSPTLGKNIALGYVPGTHSANGTPLLIEIRGKKVSAKVVNTPFYKRPSNPRTP